MALKLRIIPSLLLKNGRLVKGVAFKNHRDAGHPTATIRALCNQGADEIIVLDISDDGTRPNWGWLGQIAEGCTCPLTWGGGLKTTDDVRGSLQRGADKVFVDGKNRGLIDAASERFGHQCVTVGIDHRERDDLPGGGDNELRLVSVAREGSRRGMDTKLIQAVTERVSVPVIAEGGAGNPQHIAEAFDAGASAVAIGAMLAFSDWNIVKIKKYLRQRGYEVRL